jgi:hypothetical protein
VDSARNSLLDALKQVERRTENSASGWRLFLYGLILAPVAVAAPLILFRADVANSPLSPLLVLGLCLSAVLLFLALVLSMDIRKVIRRKLSGSDIAFRIAGVDEDCIFDAAPWPWKLMLPGNSNEASSHTTTVIQRVAWNLDWYLKPTNRLFRAQWLTTPLLMLLLTTYLGFFYIPMQIDIATTGGWKLLLPSWIGWEFHAFPLLLLLPLLYLHLRRQIWTEELVRHLRERLEA